MRMHRLSLILLFSGLLVVSPLHAGVVSPALQLPGAVNYTLTGGAITGTLNGTAFTNANFTITAVADPADFVLGNVMGVPYGHVTATSTMTIDGFASFQITTADFGPFIADYSAYFGPGAFIAAFSYTSNSTTGDQEGLYVSGLGTGDLVYGPGRLDGTFGYFNSDADNTLTLSTTSGNLIISSILSNSATFTAGDVGAVPEPTSLAIFGIGVLCVAIQARRKLKASTIA